MDRSSGILMAMSSLPSNYGIGTMGKSAYKFVDFLRDSGQRYWQLLPLCPTSYGDSPYSSFSTFAGNPYLIDFDLLVKDKLLKKAEFSGIDWGDDASRVDYGKIYQHRCVSPSAAAARSTPRSLRSFAAPTHGSRITRSLWRSRLISA